MLTVEREPSPASQAHSNGAGDPADQLGVGLQDYIAGQRHRRQPLGRESSTCTQVVWIFFWLFILIIFAYPVALIAAIWYTLLSPLSLTECGRPLVDFLMSVQQLPLTCARNMIEVKQLIVM
ncbi:Hypothetical predicted protein [Olea europaea subsp. europaea]|uniref:Uncharacterized protein n=1 Tax=Olea europaea subsp. europaea TaxID=158383 RepID=A0A8S0TKG3_OLEEU|nr:Hypothetical predicted protein [Olea europaea subsp. europaea]